MIKLHTKNKIISRRAVAPVIATLLLVAIAVVGGSIIFVFSQGFFSSAQISGSPQIESVKILGYDATDGDAIQFHDGINVLSIPDLAGNATSDGLKAGEYVAVYLKNDSVNKVTINEVRLGGEIYKFIDLTAGGADTYLPDYTTVVPGTCVAPPGNIADIDCEEYSIVIEGDDGTGLGLMSDTSAPELQPGQEITVVMALQKDVKIVRGMQFKLTTTSNAVFVGTINSGQQSG